MAERMGGIERIVDRNGNYVHPDLLKSRLKEQRKKENPNWFARLFKLGRNR